MLTSTGLGDDSLLAHPQRQQSLTDRIVNFMGTGVIEIFSLEPDLRTATMFGESLGEIEGRRTTDVVNSVARESVSENSGSCFAISYCSASSWSAPSQNVSGTKLPPKSPKRPRSSGTWLVAVIVISFGCTLMNHIVPCRTGAAEANRSRVGQTVDLRPK